jgi:Ion transport protein N-terminal.
MTDLNNDENVERSNKPTILKSTSQNVHVSTIDVTTSAPAILKHKEDNNNLLSAGYCKDFTQTPSAYLEINRRNSINIIQSNLDQSKTLHHRVKSWIAPSDTPANAKIFGGRRAVQIEQIRSKAAGWVIHPYSSLR